MVLVSPWSSISPAARGMVSLSGQMGGAQTVWDNCIRPTEIQAVYKERGTTVTLKPAAHFCMLTKHQARIAGTLSLKFPSSSQRIRSAQSFLLSRMLTCKMKLLNVLNIWNINLILCNNESLWI